MGLYRPVPKQIIRHILLYYPTQTVHWIARDLGVAVGSVAKQLAWLASDEDGCRVVASMREGARR